MRFIGQLLLLCVGVAARFGDQQGVPKQLDDVALGCASGWFKPTSVAKATCTSELRPSYDPMAMGGEPTGTCEQDESGNAAKLLSGGETFLRAASGSGKVYSFAYAFDGASWINELHLEGRSTGAMAAHNDNRFFATFSTDGELWSDEHAIADCQDLSHGKCTLRLSKQVKMSYVKLIVRSSCTGCNNADYVKSLRVKCAVAKVLCGEGLGAAPIVTPDGHRCIVLDNCASRASRDIDGVVWDYTGNDVQAPRPERTSRNAHQTWFANTFEVSSPRVPRPIASPARMRVIDYSSHMLPNADYPIYLRYLPSSGSWRKMRRALDKPALWARKTVGILYLSSNCDVDSHRDGFAREIEKVLDIDAVGACNHNRDWPVRLKAREYDRNGVSLRKLWRVDRYFDSAEALLKMYHFRLLVISTICEDYFAEKLLQTLTAGVIPIYLGMPNSHDWDPGLAAGGHPAMIHVQDFDSLADLSEFILSLGADTDEARRRRRRYFEFVKSPPADYPRHLPAITDKVHGLDWPTWVCSRTHGGRPSRPASPQLPCKGSWLSYFRGLGKDVKKWQA
jgi:hypothetical protein